MAQLGRFDEYLIDAAGNAIIGATVAIRRQGATVSASQSGASPLTVNVNDIGAILASDTVVIGTGTTTYNVDSVSIANQTITLSGFSGTLALADDDRISPTNNLPTLYEDIAGAETKTNPLQSSLVIGQVSAWLNHGHYDRHVSGAGLTTRLHLDMFVSALGPFTDGGSARHGIRIDNLTDDGVSLNNAISDLARTLSGIAQGGTLELHKGTILTSVPIINKTKVIVRGAGRGATFIKAAAGFTFNGTTDSLVRLGDGTATVHGCKFMDISLDCNDIANSIAVYSTEANELSGLERCSLRAPVLYGVFVSGTSAANYSIKDCEIFMSGSGSAVTSKGIYVHNSTGVIRVTGCTINNLVGSGVTMLAGIHAAHVGGHLVSIRDCHFENATNGVKCSSNGVHVDSVVGHSTITNVVLIDTGVGTVSCESIFANSSTNTISDVQNSVTISSGDTPLYLAGGTASAKVISNNSTVTWKVPNAVDWAGAHTFAAAVTYSSTAALSGVVTASGSLDITGRIRKQSFEDVAIGTTISVTKNNVRITGNGPVTLSTINVDAGAPGAAHDGMEVFIMRAIGTTGDYTIDQGGNIRLESGNSIVLTTGQAATFKWCNSESLWIQSTTKVSHP